jgi:hypothetical protein
VSTQTHPLKRLWTHGYISPPRGGRAIVVMRQLPRGSFFGKARLFLKNAWHFKDIFIEFEAFLKWYEAFLKISKLFNYIFSLIETFLKCCEAFKKIRRFLKIFKEK